MTFYRLLLLWVCWVCPVGLSAQPLALEQLAGKMPDQLGWIAFLSAVTLLPFGVMLLTSFTRISIIFQFLRQALGTLQIPSNQIVIGLSLILTGFVMHPVIEEIQHQAIAPYLNKEWKQLPEVVAGTQTEEALLGSRLWEPMRRFLFKQTREKDILLFMEMAKKPLPPEGQLREIEEAIPWYCLVPGFVISELRAAFTMGFLLFLPFLVIDLVVSAILMSLGLILLPPSVVALPFKLLLFILIDGWQLIVQQMVHGFSTFP